MQKRYFDTYGSWTTTKNCSPLGVLRINRHCSCCNQGSVVLRRIFDDLDEMYDFALNECARLNRKAVHEFLRHRPLVLRQVFDLADVDGVILTRGLFKASHAMADTLKLKMPNMTENRFIAVCRILEKYRILYPIGDELFITSVGNAL